MLSDSEVVARAREGDRAAYDEMVRRFRPAVYDFIYRMVGHRELAEDLTHDTFLKVFSTMECNGPERRPSAWIRQVAHNTAWDYVKRKRPDSTRSPLTVTPGEIERQALHVMTTPSDTPTSGTDVGESVAALKRAIKRLRPEYRRCFVLRYTEHKSYAEIARIMNLPASTVGTYLQRAREELKRRLGG